MKHISRNGLSRRQFISSSVAAGVMVNFPLYAANKDTVLWAPYKNSIVIDGLGGAFDVQGAGKVLLQPSALSIYRQSGITCVNQTIPYPGDDGRVTQEKIQNTLDTIDSYPESLTLIQTAEDILQAKTFGKLGIIMGFQSTEMFNKDPEVIASYAKLGVRIMQLSYNGPSAFGQGGLVNNKLGLTQLGAQAITEMEQHRVLLDLSHSNQKTVAEAIQLANRPMTISHTGCNSIYPHPRNNDDRELKAVADKGGVVGIYLMPFLRGGTDEIRAQDVLRHLQHAIRVCGEEHVSIGSDQGIIPVNDTPEYRQLIHEEVERRIAAGISAPGETPNRPPFVPELNKTNRMEVIAWQLHKAGFSDDKIEKILGKNLLRLYHSVWG